MTRAELLAYSLAKPGAWLDEPWEGDVVVKVASKIFPAVPSRTTKCSRRWTPPMTRWLPSCPGRTVRRHRDPGRSPAERPSGITATGANQLRRGQR